MLTEKKTIKFSVPGPPKRKKRVRFGQGRTYTHKDTVAYENLIKFFFDARCPGWHPQRGPTTIDIIAYFPIPKSRPKWWRALSKDYDMPYMKTPDVDNIFKVVADALNGIAYVDDKQIYDGRIQSFYSERPRLNIKITFYKTITKTTLNRISQASKEKKKRDSR